ncbi:hypothetical protein P7D22_06850 [Lichenihabitans sp. Uapishka_5]|uniref:hypothetical protein n=1 Tax=Lichenihabitans sp. Uapishka_5 TaxID=3037302 RepID=UPI0029E7D1F8|nr:hypothetical protein [Lichenihabitans sp. Uapishka_5]MDX7950895.1 hypothetical protein [Lichenihabitans sp. Uapishka_5]
MRGFLVFAACLLPTVALAQLDLSGATAPAPAGTVVTPAPAKPKAPRPPRVVPAAPPAESTLGGKTLSLNGGRSQVTFAPRDKTVDVARLLLAGHKISNGRDECQVDVSGMPLRLTPLDKANGLVRYAIPLSACPLSFDVLSGAIVTHADAATCSFKEADCQAAVVGLWGAQPGDIGADQVKAIERDRTAAEKEVRAAYKALVSSTKDRAVIKDYASDQAGFSSHREEACRDYIGESRHGFCAARLTQARATSLEAALVVAQAAKEERRRKRAGRNGRR